MDSEARPNPIEMVAREIHEGCSSSEEQVSSALRNVLLVLFDRAFEALERDPLSSETLNRIREYRVASEVIVVFGTALKALEDIENHELGRTAGHRTPLRS